MFSTEICFQQFRWSFSYSPHCLIFPISSWSLHTQNYMKVQQVHVLLSFRKSLREQLNTKLLQLLPKQWGWGTLPPQKWGLWGLSVSGRKESWARMVCNNEARVHIWRSSLEFWSLYSFGKSDWLAPWTSHLPLGTNAVLVPLVWSWVLPVPRCRPRCMPRALRRDNDVHLCCSWGCWPSPSAWQQYMLSRAARGTAGPTAVPLLTVHIQTSVTWEPGIG